jgi:hypothetical protein
MAVDPTGLSYVGDALSGGGNLFGAASADPRVAMLLAWMQNNNAQEAARKAKIKKSAFQDTKDSGFDAQQSALQQLQEIAKTGQTAAANAQRQEFLTQENARLGGNREAILRGEQMRSGGNNTGNRLTAQLLEGQGSAARGNQNALTSANLVQDSQMKALGGIGGFTGQLQNRASALDAIKMFNSQNIMNAANAGNQALGGVTSNQQFNAGNQQGTNQALLGLLGSGIGGAARGVAASDERLKTNIKKADIDIEDFLDRLKSKKFKYKGSENQKTGIIAQDLEKSRVGKNLVVEAPEGKYVDLDESVPVLMSAVANLNKRLRDLQHA